MKVSGFLFRLKHYKITRSCLCACLYPSTSVHDLLHSFSSVRSKPNSPLFIIIIIVIIYFLSSIESIFHSPASLLYLIVDIFIEDPTLDPVE